MLTPEQINALRDAAGAIADPINAYIIQDVARRIAQAGQLTSTAAYQIWRAQQLGMSQAEIKVALQKLLRKSRTEINRLLQQSAEVGYRFDLSRLPHTRAVPFAENEAVQRIVSAAVELADEEFTNMTQTLGMVDPYGHARPLQEAYQTAVDFAFQQVITGAADYNTAIRQATRHLADKGLQVVDYASGVHTSLEAAVRRCVMGGIGLMSEQIAQVDHDELGCNGWEISAHAGSAPDHEPIQGQQYPDEEYQALNNSLVRRIGTLNCGHTASPIILGVSEPQYTKAELAKFREDNEKGITYQGKHYTLYEATQKQRQIERAIRLQKRRIQVDEAAGDGERLEQDKIKLRRLNTEYRLFSRAADLPLQRERAQIAGPWDEGAAALEVPTGPAQGGTPFDPGMVDSAMKRLEKSPGLSDNIAMLKFYAQTTPFVERKSLSAPIAYSPAADAVGYNPNIPLPEGVDQDGIVYHELAHRAATLAFGGLQDPQWMAAIDAVSSEVMARRDEVQAWFDAGGKYRGNAFFADIISALSRGAIYTRYSHEDEAWLNAGIIANEVFANLVSMDALDGRADPILDGLYARLREILEGGAT